MAEEVQKKGMSKGCLITLIVAGVLLVLVIALVFVCNAYKDELIQSTTNSALISMKQSVASNLPDGIDSVQFNAVTDKFLERFAKDTVDLERFAVSFEGIQELFGKKEFDAASVKRAMEMMQSYYPDLKGIVPATDMIDSTMVDSLITQ